MGSEFSVSAASMHYNGGNVGIGTTPVALPLGLDQDREYANAMISIIGMRFTPTRGSFNATAWVEFPKVGDDVGIGIGASDVCIDKDGFGGQNKIMFYCSKMNS